VADDEERLSLPTAAGIACSLVNGAWREQFDGDLRLVCAALARVAPIFAAGRVLPDAEIERRLSDPEAPLDGLWIRRRDLHRAVSTLKASVLLSALRLQQSRSAISRSRRLLHPGSGSRSLLSG
jgi:hypothetical protein